LATFGTFQGKEAEKLKKPGTEPGYWGIVADLPIRAIATPQPAMCE
jgi:hypothetical protein